MTAGKPSFSCICLTYGRWWLLEEAIASYLAQDYPHRELIIVNDMPGQKLYLPSKMLVDHEIRIYNLPKRLSDINEKFDYGVDLAVGSHVCFWDDDDISLKNRLDVHAKYIMANPYGYHSMPWRFHLDAGRPMELIPRGCHGGDAFSRELYLQLGGSTGPGHNDQNAVERFKEAGQYAMDGTADEANYIYRWAGITGHHSAYGASVADCMAHFDATVRADRRFKLGDVELAPRWRGDYAAMAEECRKRSA
jgi:hypothetical protein